MFVEQDISEIVVGTYIVKILEQTGDHKLTSPGWVRSDTVIAALKKKGIKRLLVDPSKQRLQQPVLAFPPIPPSVVTPIAAETPQSDSSAAAEQDTFLEEISQAQELFSASKELQKKVFEDVKNGAQIDLAPVRELTDESIDVIFKNSDALACVINLRNKDEYLLEHSIAVSMLMAFFARHLGIEKKIIRELSIGAFLHDVGKIRTPDHILNKPGKLTDAEFEIMKEHVKHSIDIIKATPGISHLSLRVAALHHERLNGVGYPYGLTGDKISTYGRMIAICDVFDALTANRCYKQGYSPIKSLRILRTLAEEGQLDPLLVDSFIRCMGVYPVGSLVRLNSDRLAIVEHKNKTDPIRPKVNAFYCLKKRDFAATNRIDLAGQDEEKIVQCVRANDFDLDMEQIMKYLASEG